MKKITLSHGNGGFLMHRLIRDLFVKNLGNRYLNELDDAALIRLGKGRFAYTTDSFVIQPIFFPGGDIGKLAVCGTINDLAVCGARPRYISCAMIVEEGLEYSDLERITLSIKSAARSARVDVVTGDFKVVERGAVDKVFINTTGIGEVFKDIKLSMSYIRPGDKIIINGTIGDHASAVLISREGLKFKAKILSDCTHLDGLVASIICSDIKFMRDPTRGGLATTLNEISAGCGYNIRIDEKDVPIKRDVRALCEILGLDPFYMANEGKLIVVVSPRSAQKILHRMKRHPLGRYSNIIGEVEDDADGRVYLKTAIGGKRILDMLKIEQLPRIC